MAPMTSGPLLVYEIPDAGGRGHRLVIPEGSDIPADEAVALIASIRGPVHLDADRLGVVRPSTQRSRGGAIRGSAVVALIAGIDVANASSRTVVSALATLENSLDAVVAEAADAVVVNDSPVMESRAAVKTLQTIAVEFRDAPVAHVASTESVSAEQRPRPSTLVTDVPLLAGTFATLMTGVFIGWAARGGKSPAPPDPPIPNIGPQDFATTMVAPGDDTRTPATSSRDSEGGPPNALEASTRSTGTAGGQAASQAGAGAVADFPLSKPQADMTDTDRNPTFYVTCRGTKPGDRIQLLRGMNQSSIGAEEEARSDRHDFKVIAPHGLTSPDQLKVRVSEKPHQSRLSPNAHVSDSLTQLPDSDDYCCTIRVGDSFPRDITVTVTTRGPAD